jgi:hypothetical protein
MNWQHVCLPLKSYIVDVDDQAIAWYHCWIVLAMVLPSHAGDGAVRYQVMLATVLPRWLGRNAM